MASPAASKPPIEPSPSRVVVRVPGRSVFATAWSAADPSLSYTGEDAWLWSLVTRASKARSTPDRLEGRLPVMTILPDGHAETATFPTEEATSAPDRHEALDEHYRPYLSDLLQRHQPTSYTVDVLMTWADSVATLITVPEAGLMLTTGYDDPFPREEILQRVSAAWQVHPDQLELKCQVPYDVLPAKRIDTSVNRINDAMFASAFDSTMSEGMRLLGESVEHLRTIWLTRAT